MISAIGTRAIAAAYMVLAGIIPANAQQPPAQDSAIAVVEEWNGYQLAQKHLSVAIVAMTIELRKVKDELAAVTKERDDLKAQSAKPQ